MKLRTGHLVKRGKGYSVQWRVDGKSYLKALRDEHGGPITVLRQAREAAAKWMAQFAVADEAEALASIAARLDSKKAELVAIEDAKHPSMRLVEAWPAYLRSGDKPDSGPGTLRMYEGQWFQFLKWIQLNHPSVDRMAQVGHEIATQYAGHLNHGRLAVATGNKHLRLLTLVFRILKRTAKLSDNPWVDISRKKAAPKGRRELRPDELRKLCGTAEGELRTLLAIGTYSGLRLGDCATLLWEEVDMARRTITRVPRKTGRGKPEPVLIPMHRELLGVLDSTPLENRKGYVLPELSELYLKRSDLLTDRIMRHMHSCGIVTTKQGTGSNGLRAVVEVGFHSLRHSFVSMCRASGAPLSVVEAIVGHSNPAMTRHYSHVSPAESTAAVDALPELMNAPDAVAAPEPLQVRVRALAQTMTCDNWQAVMAQLLAIE